MQFYAVARLLCSPRLLLSTRQTGPIPGTPSCGLQLSAVVNDDGSAKAMPDRPKRPMNTYIRFVQSIRSSLISDNPKASPTEISKLAAVKWQGLDQASKTKLEEEYKREQAVWLQKNAKYLSQLTDSQKEELKLERQQKHDNKVKRDQKRMMKDLGRPKRPMNGFLRFCSKNKPVQGLSTEDNKMQMKNLGMQWKRLPEVEKERYTKEAEVDMKRYQEEMKQWETKMLASDKLEAVRRKNVLLPSSPMSPSPAKRGPTVEATHMGKPKKSTTRP
ncbi:transcription factor A, mitochondrial [Anopheles nili]|uniref:transcription factor A, mitochondrial n=1 Tax=Anopheles nili TaxID=185578 RepID=UPI00237A638A|nr:transcription factor A, mitochondrial [Anopheles nili]